MMRYTRTLAGSFTSYIAGAQSYGYYYAGESHYSAKSIWITNDAPSHTLQAWMTTRGKNPSAGRVTPTCPATRTTVKTADALPPKTEEPTAAECTQATMGKRGGCREGGSEREGDEGSGGKSKHVLGPLSCTPPPANSPTYLPTYLPAYRYLWLRSVITPVVVTPTTITETTECSCAAVHAAGFPSGHYKFMCSSLNFDYTSYCDNDHAGGIVAAYTCFDRLVLNHARGC